MKLDDVIKEHIIKVVNESTSRREAAKKLGISVKTIYNHYIRWGLSSPRDEFDCMRNLTNRQRNILENKNRRNRNKINAIQ